MSFCSSSTRNVDEPKATYRGRDRSYADLVSVVTRFDVPMFTNGDGQPSRAISKNAVAMMPTALLY